MKDRFKYANNIIPELRHFPFFRGQSESNQRWYRMFRNSGGASGWAVGEILLLKLRHFYLYRGQSETTEP